MNVKENEESSELRNETCVNFQKKVVYIKKTCEILARDYEGDIPPTLKEMCQLPGVGPKMAHLCMDIGWGKLTGIGERRL